MSNVLKIADRPSGFEDWFAVFPKHVGKAIAKSLWEAITGPGLETRTLNRDAGTYIHLTLKATPEELLEGAKRYRERQIDRNTYKLKDDGKYTCHPSTWLNQGRWMDE